MPGYRDARIYPLDKPDLTRAKALARGHMRSGKAVLQTVARAKMILLAHQGLSNDQIADCLSTRREIVSRWRKRFFEKRLAGLEDCQRPGRPRVFPPRADRAG